MTKLLYLHYDFLYTKIIRSISVVLVLIMGFILLFQSNLIGDSLDRLIHLEFYTESFLINGLNIIKTMIVVYSMLFSIYSFSMNKYDVFLIYRTSRAKLIVSKLVIVMFIVVSSMLTYYLFFSLFLIILANTTFLFLFELFLQLLIFTVFYSLFFSLLLLIFDNLFVAIIPFVGYIISSFSIDYGVLFSEISSFSKMIHVMFPDLIVLNKKILFIFGETFVLIEVVLFLLLCIKIYDKNDIKL